MGVVNVAGLMLPAEAGGVGLRVVGGRVLFTSRIELNRYVNGLTEADCEAALGMERGGVVLNVVGKPILGNRRIVALRSKVRKRLLSVVELDNATPEEEAWLVEEREGTGGLKRFKREHVRAVELRLQGYSAAAIAEKLGVSRRTVEVWFDMPMFEWEVERQRGGGKVSVADANEALERRRRSLKVRSEGGVEVVGGGPVDLERCRTDLFYFAREVLGYSLLEESIHGPLCRMLADASNRRVAVCLPRGWFKSTVCSVAFPVWLAVHDPNVRILVVQNTMDNAVLKLRSIGAHFEENALLRRLYESAMPTPSCVWTDRAKSLPRSKAHAEPTFSAAGVRTRIVSRHYDVIIEDDTAAPELDDLGLEGGLLPTADQMEQAIGWHNLAQPLLTDLQKGRIVVVATRWFERDLLSYIREKQPQYVWYERAAVERDGVADDSGELVWPSRFGREVLDELKQTMGPYFYNALYLNRPVSTADAVFKPEWFKHYRAEQWAELVKDKRAATYTTVDMATDPALAKGVTDYTAVVTCTKLLDTGEIYVRRVTRRRMNVVEMVDAVLEHCIEFDPVRVGVEAISFQRVLMYALQERMRQMDRFWTVELLHTGTRSKEQRISALQPLFAAGKVFLMPEHAILESELLAFPRGKFDDCADALSMQLQVMGRTGYWQDKQIEVNNPLSIGATVKYLQRRATLVNAGNPVLDVLKLRQ